MAETAPPRPLAWALAVLALAALGMTALGLVAFLRPPPAPAAGGDGMTAAELEAILARRAADQASPSDAERAIALSRQAHPEIRAAAARILGLLTDPACRDRLLAMASGDPDDHPRLAALHGLWQQRDARLQPLLVDFLTRDDIRRRQAAAEVLQRGDWADVFADGQLIAAVKTTLAGLPDRDDHHHRRTRHLLIGCLARHPSPAHCALLAKVATGTTDEEAHWHVYEALRRCATEKEVGVVAACALELGRHEDDVNHNAVAHMIHRLPRVEDAAAIAAIGELFQIEHDDSDRWEDDCFEWLAEVRDARAAPWLVEAMLRDIERDDIVELFDEDGYPGVVKVDGKWALEDAAAMAAVRKRIAAGRERRGAVDEF